MENECFVIYVCSTSEVQCNDRKTTERAFSKFENTIYAFSIVNFF